MTDIEKELEEHVRRIIELMGENATREGLQKTPHRVAKAMQTLTRGYAEDPIAILNSAKFREDYRQMVNNAHQIGLKLREGNFLKKALEDS